MRCAVSCKEEKEAEEARNARAPVLKPHKNKFTACCASAVRPGKNKLPLLPLAEELPPITAAILFSGSTGNPCNAEPTPWRVHELELACAYRASNDEEQAVGEEERDAGWLIGCNLIDPRSVVDGYEGVVRIIN